MLFQPRCVYRPKPAWASSLSATADGLLGRLILLKKPPKELYHELYHWAYACRRFMPRPWRT